MTAPAHRCEGEVAGHVERGEVATDRDVAAGVEAQVARHHQAAVEVTPHGQQPAIGDAQPLADRDVAGDVVGHEQAAPREIHRLAHGQATHVVAYHELAVGAEGHVPGLDASAHVVPDAQQAAALDRETADVQHAADVGIDGDRAAVEGDRAERGRAAQSSGVNVPVRAEVHAPQAQPVQPAVDVDFRVLTDAIELERRDRVVERRHRTHEIGPAGLDRPQESRLDVDLRDLQRCDMEMRPPRLLGDR